MFGWFRRIATFASSTNIEMNFALRAKEGSTRLRTRIFSIPSAPVDLARNTSAIPPVPKRRRMR